MLEYLKKVTRTYDLYPHIKFNTEVRGQVWDEGIKKWRVSYLDKSDGMMREELFDIV